jgi:hypothetical protein
MTFFRETWRLLGLAAAATIAGSAFIAAPVQAATINFGSCASGGTYTNVAVDGSGNFTITCTAVGPQPGTIAFSPNTYTANVSSQVTVSLTRSNGSAGAASSSVTAAGGCAVAPGSVSWTDGDAATKTVTVTTTPATGSCTLSGSTVTTAGSTTISATVNVVDPNVPGTFAFSQPQSGPGLNQDWSFTIQRTGGTNGTYDIPFTAVPTGLTGASILEASPIRFNTGETTKTLTLRTGSTAGSMVVTFGVPIPVAPTTTPTTAGGAITLVVTAGTGNCPSPASNVVLLPDMPVGEGAHTLINLAPGQIGSSKLPTLPAGVVGATITETQTQGTGDISRIEIGISPCPGDLLWGAKASDGGPGTNQQVAGGSYQPCYTSSPFISNVSVAWHLTVSGHYAFCYAPVATGPWYVNVRYTMPAGCSYGQGNCGASFQWNRR